MASRKSTSAELPSTSSGGGPVILLPAELAAEWRGTQPPKGAKVPKGWTWGKSGGPVCDYDRACDGGKDKIATARGGIAVLSVGKGSGIVLDAELVTVWLPTDEGGIVARGPDMDGSDPDAVAELVPEKGWKKLMSLELVDGRVFLFDSAATGAKTPAKIQADDGVAIGEPGAGKYDVSWVSSKTNDFVRFARIGGAPKPGVKAPGPKKSKPKEPAWKTRAIASSDLPKPNRPESANQVLLPVWRPDGTVVGLEKEAPRKFHVVHVSKAGKKTVVTESASDYSGIDFAWDDDAVLVSTLSGKVMRLALPGAKTKAAPREIFSCKDRIWRAMPLGPGRMVIARPDVIHLVAVDGDGAKAIATADVAPNEVPMLAALGDKRFVYVQGGKMLHLFAVVGDELRDVESYVQTRRGIIVHGEKAYFYSSKQTHIEEILNFDEIYATLS